MTRLAPFSGRRLENFTRIETFGDNVFSVDAQHPDLSDLNNVHWVKAFVDPHICKVHAETVLSEFSVDNPFGFFRRFLPEDWSATLRREHLKTADYSACPSRILFIGCAAYYRHRSSKANVDVVVS